MSEKRNYNDGTTLNTRAYSWDIVIYEISKEYLQEKLNTLTNIGVVKHYAYIIHNMDKQLDDNNNIIDKPLHCHLLITFNQNVSIKTIKERIIEYTEHNMFGQPLKDKRGAYRYLTHKDDSDKYQYNDIDIVNYDDYFSKFDITTDLQVSKEYQEINNMIDDYSTLSYRQLACKYGKDFIRNFRAYQFYFDLIIEQEGGK